MTSHREVVPSSASPTRPLTQRGLGGPGIRAREVFPYILAFTLCVVTLGIFLSLHIAHLYKQEVADWRARQSSIADDRAHSVSGWLTARQADAHVFAALPSVRAVLRAHDEGGQFSKYPSAGLSDSLAVLDEMAKSYSYAGVYILDRDAHVVAQSSQSIPLDPLFAETCRAVAHSGVMRIDLVGDAPHRSLIGFSAPVFPAPGTTDAGRPPGQLLGVALVVSDAAQTLFPRVTRDVIPTRTGETLLVRREGNDIAFFSPLRHAPAGSQYLRLPFSSSAIPARLALEGRETFGEYNDYRGVPVLATTQNISLTGWGLVRKIDRAEALENFRRMAVAEGLAGGLLIILLGGLLLFLRRDVMTRVLKQKEEKFRALLESAPDAIYIIDPSTLRILERNHKAAEMDGYSDEDITHMMATDLHPPEDHTLLQERLARGSEVGGILPLHTTHHRRKDGQLVPVEESQKLVDAGGEKLVLSIVHDITERQRAEQDLRRLNRALRTISDCNQVLVRCMEEPHLLGEVCGILVREGGYRMAWVGFAEHDEGKSVRPVAKAGFDDGYLQTANITWEDTERGRGPTGTAIRTGKPVVVRDIQNDPSLAPWREEALKRGYASTIALPILLNDHVPGALTIYAGEPDAFDPAEIQLLTELSNDLAYGIQALRTRADHQRAEGALRESEGTYRTLVENIPQKIFMKSRDYRWVSVNENFARGLGIRPEDMVGKVDYDLFPKELADKYHADDKRIMETGVTDEFDEEYMEGNERRIVYTIKTPVRDESGAVIGLLGVFWDVTERKRAEDALRESAERARIVAESVSDVIYEWDLKDKIEWHGDVDSLMGYPASGYPRTMDGWAATLHPEDLERVRRAIQSQLKGEAAYNVDYRLAGKDGEWRWWSARGTVLRDEQGQPRRWVGAITDITERKRAEEALIESEAQFRTLANAIPQLCWMANAEGWIFWYNQLWYEYTGTTPEQMEGWGWQSVHDPEALPKVLVRWKASIATGEPFDMVFPLRGADGVFRPFLTRVKPVRDQSGKVSRWFGTNTDITERQRAEDQVQRLNEDLEQRVRERTADLEASNKELEAFTYSVSHDLRAPLRHIDGFSKLLVEEHRAELSPDAQEYIATIRDSAIQMGILIDDLLNLARVGRKELVMQVTGLNSLVEEVRTELNRANPDRVIEWKVDALPFVECDPALMKQVFVNLLSNAVKYTRPRKAAVIEAGATQQDGRPVVFVRDNGVGFSMKYANKLFGVFQRLHRSEDFEGTGVGLATVQRIVHKHGGRVWAEAELDKGATFYFTLGSPDDPPTEKGG